MSLVLGKTSYTSKWFDNPYVDGMSVKIRLMTASQSQRILDENENEGAVGEDGKKAENWYNLDKLMADVIEFEALEWSGVIDEKGKAVPLSRKAIEEIVECHEATRVWINTVAQNRTSFVDEPALVKKLKASSIGASERNGEKKKNKVVSHA